MTGSGCLLRGFVVVCTILLVSSLNLVVPVPVAPIFLWPVPLALVAVGLIPWPRWRADGSHQALRADPMRDQREPDALSPEPPPGRPRRAALALQRWMRPASVTLGAIGCVCLTCFSLPPVDGLIRDEATGAPVKGATVCLSASAKHLDNLESWKGSTRFGRVRRCVSDEHGRFGFWGEVALFPVGVDLFTVLRGAGVTGASVTVLHPAYGVGCGGVEVSDLGTRFDGAASYRYHRLGPGCSFDWDGRPRRIRVSVRLAPHPRRADGSPAVSRADALAFLEGWEDLTRLGGCLSLHDFASLVEAQAAIVPLDAEMASVIERTRSGALSEPFRPARPGDGKGSAECLTLVRDYCRRHPAARTCDLVRQPPPRD